MKATTFAITGAGYAEQHAVSTIRLSPLDFLHVILYFELQKNYLHNVNKEQFTFNMEDPIHCPKRIKFVDAKQGFSEHQIP